MKKGLLISLLFLLVGKALLAQSVVLSDAQVTMPVPPKAGDTQALWGVGCSMSLPVDNCSLIVLAGSSKDKNDAGTGKVTFYQVEASWQVLPSEVHYTNNKIWMALPIERSRQQQVNVFTFYVVDKKGAEISNRLYYQLGSQ